MLLTFVFLVLHTENASIDCGLRAPVYHAVLLASSTFRALDADWRAPFVVMLQTGLLLIMLMNDFTVLSFGRLTLLLLERLLIPFLR